MKKETPRRQKPPGSFIFHFDETGPYSLSFLLRLYLVPEISVQWILQIRVTGAEMKQIVGINHVGIRVADLAQSRHFYAQLGFEFLAGPMGPEPVAIMEEIIWLAVWAEPH